MKRTFVMSACSLLLVSFLVQAQRVIPYGSKIFIAPMESGLDGFIAAEILKEKLPVRIVTDETQADFILTGGSIKGDDKWYHSVFGGKDKNEGNVQLISVREKNMVWASEAGDRSLWWGSLKRGGQRKVADRLVNNMKKAVDNGKGLAVVPASSPSAAAPSTAPSKSSVAPTAKVTITSELSGAEIEVDGQFVGSTPTTLELPEGNHKILVKSASGIWQRDIKIHSGSAITVSAVFEKTESSGSPPAVAKPETVKEPLTEQEPPRLNRSSTSVEVIPRTDAPIVEAFYIDCGQKSGDVPFSTYRSGPKTLKCGAEVTVLGTSGEWTRVRTKENVEGSVSSRFVRKKNNLP